MFQVKRWENMYCVNQKKTDVVKLIADKVYIQARSITRDKEGYLIMTRVNSAILKYCKNIAILQ